VKSIPHSFSHLRGNMALKNEWVWNIHGDPFNELPTTWWEKRIQWPINI